LAKCVVAILAPLVVNTTIGCSGIDSSSGKGDKSSESEQGRPSSPDPKTPASKPFGLVGIDAFLGISPDFKVYAVSEAGVVKVIDLETGKPVPSPTWDRDWGHPRSVAFGNDFVAVVTSGAFVESVKIFSRETGELEENIRGQVNEAAFSASGRFLAITECRKGGYHLTLRDIQKKKPIAEVGLGNFSWCSLAMAGNWVAAYESDHDQITVVQAETGTVVKKLKPASFLKRSRGRMPLAISPAGNLLACGAEDAVVLYDIDGGKVAQKLEGHLDVVEAVAFSPNRETVASAAKDKTIRFWNIKEGKEVNRVKNLPASPSELIFSADGKRIAVIYHNNDVFRGAQKNAEIRNVVPK
jgi:WD40 repeat protein